MKEQQIKKLIEKRINDWHIEEISVGNVIGCNVLMDMNSSFNLEKLKSFSFEIVKDISEYEKSKVIVEKLEEDIK